MNNPWLAVLKALPLEREEKEILKRFEKDPEGRSFLAAAEILKSHKKNDECVELLSFGINHHPAFTIARIVLVRELFNRGLIAEASRVLQEAQSDISDNILALKLGFRINLLQSRYSEARNALLSLKALNSLDPETKRFSDAFELQSPQIARDLLRRHLELLGVAVILPDAESRSDTSFELLPERIELPPLTTNDIDDLLIKSFTIDAFDEEKIGGFHAARLSEIFLGDGPEEQNWRADSTPKSIDSLTLVDIYAKQGHYRKAITMLKRLVSSHPSNDHLKSKIRELSALEKNGVPSASRVDVLEDLETVHIIDKQINFYEGMPKKLANP